MKQNADKANHDNCAYKILNNIALIQNERTYLIPFGNLG